MTTWIVSRHPGAVAWLQNRYELGTSTLVEHLDADAIKAEDRVVGTLPVQLIAAVCQRGAHYYHLQIPMARNNRGRELSAADLDALGATLQCFYARPGDSPAIPRADAL